MDEGVYFAMKEKPQIIRNQHNLVEEFPYLI